jgi:hypothetical protein
MLLSSPGPPSRAHRRNYFRQQELPAARTSTSLARVLGHSAPKMPDSHKRDACFVLLGQALRAHFCLRLRSHKQKRQGNSDVVRTLASRQPYAQDNDVSRWDMVSFPKEKT